MRLLKIADLEAGEARNAPLSQRILWSPKQSNIPKVSTRWQHSYLNIIMTCSVFFPPLFLMISCSWGLTYYTLNQFKLQREMKVNNKMEKSEIVKYRLKGKSDIQMTDK